MQLDMITCKSWLSQQTAAAVGAGLWQRQDRRWPLAWRPVETRVIENPDVRAETFHDMCQSEISLAQLQILSSRVNCPEADAIANRAVFDSPWFSDKNNLAFLRLLVQRAGMGHLTNYTQLYDLWDAVTAMVRHCQRHVRRALRECAVVQSEQNIRWPAWMETGKMRTLKSLLDAGAAIAFNEQAVVCT